MRYIRPMLPHARSHGLTTSPAVDGLPSVSPMVRGLLCGDRDGGWRLWAVPSAARRRHRPKSRPTVGRLARPGRTVGGVTTTGDRCDATPVTCHSARFCGRARSVNVLPTPSVLSTVMRPLVGLGDTLGDARPSPLPPNSRLRALSVR